MTVSSRIASTGPRLIVAMLALGALLGGCAKRTAEADTLAFGPDDIRERHPIVLRDAPRSLDVFVGRSGGTLDARQA